MTPRFPVPRPSRRAFALRGPGLTAGARRPDPGRADRRPPAPQEHTSAGTASWGTPPAAVLFDRDGTLVHDVPYNGDPARVRPMTGAVEAVRLARASGWATGVISNQSGIGRGLLTEDDVRRVDARVDEVFGAFAVWEICPHAPEAGCGCRKPAPGLVLAAARRLGVDPRACVVIGDIGADLAAARAAGARGIIVPTAVTRPEEHLAEPHTAPDLLTAVRQLLVPPPAESRPAGPEAACAGSGAPGADAPASTTAADAVPPDTATGGRRPPGTPTGSTAPAHPTGCQEPAGTRAAGAASARGRTAGPGKSPAGRPGRWCR